VPNQAIFIEAVRCIASKDPMQAGFYFEDGLNVSREHKVQL
jgi:hypothetical protein